MSTPEKRPVSFFSLFNRGQHYAKTWPLDKRLAPVFIENRIIRATRYACLLYTSPSPRDTR